MSNYNEMYTDVLSISGSNSELSDGEQDQGRERRLSISLYLGSSEDEEKGEKLDEQFNNRLPKFYLKNENDEIISFYKKLVFGKKNSLDTTNFLQTSLDFLQNAHNQLWTVILFNGNHFAAAVFEGEKVVVHRTFHHYVVRAKRGTAQSANDSKGGHAKSAGANLRRYNEASQARLIQELLTEWKDDYLNNCQLIFMRIPSYKRALFYGGRTPIFSQKDIRLRPIPFTTRRPTFNEVVRTHKELYSVTVHDTEGAAKMFEKRANNDARRSAEKQRKKMDAQQQEKQKNARKRKEKKKQEAYTTPSLTQLLVEETEDLVMVEESISTDILSEFGIDPEIGKKNKKKKKTRNVQKNQSIPQNSEEVEEVALTESPSQERRNMNEKVKFYDKFPRHESQLIINLYTGCMRGEVEQVYDLLTNKRAVTSQSGHDLTEPAQAVEEDKLATLLSSSIDDQGNTLLHVVSKSGNSQLIGLLLEYGADPCIRNFHSYLPYNLCPHKTGRNVFRRFRASNPHKYDYKKAEIPSPLTEEVEKEIANRQAEKKKEKKEKRKQKEKKKKEEQKAQKAEELERERYVAMTDREKRLLAIEKRMKTTEAPQVSASITHNRCMYCGESLFAKVPFTYFDYSFCSTKCLKTHRNKNSGSNSHNS